MTKIIVAIAGIIALGVIYGYVANLPEETFLKEIAYYQENDHTVFKGSFAYLTTWIDWGYRWVSRMELREIIEDLESRNGRLFNLEERYPEISIADISADTTGKAITFNMKLYSKKELECIVEVAGKLNKKVNQKNTLLRVIFPIKSCSK